MPDGALCYGLVNGYKRYVVRGEVSPVRGLRGAVKLRKDKVILKDEAAPAPPEVDRPPAQDVESLKGRIAVLKSRNKNLAKQAAARRRECQEKSCELTALGVKMEEMTHSYIGSVPLEDYLEVKERLAKQEEEGMAALSQYHEELSQAVTKTVITEGERATLQSTLSLQEASFKERLAECESALKEATTRHPTLRYTSGTQATLSPPSINPTLHLLEDLELTIRRTAQSHCHDLLATLTTTTTRVLSTVHSQSLAVRERHKGALEGVTDCNRLLRKKVSALEEALASLKSDISEYQTGLSTATAERARLESTLHNTERVARDMTQQVEHITAKATKYHQKYQALQGVKTELQASEGERTRLTSENELLKDKLRVGLHLEEHLKKQLVAAEEAAAQVNVQNASMKNEVAELRQVSESKSKDLALVRGLKVQQQAIYEETNARFEILHDATDSILTIMSAERRDLMYKSELNAHDQDQLRLIQLVQEQQEQLNLFNSKLDNLYAHPPPLRGKRESSLVAATPHSDKGRYLSKEEVHVDEEVDPGKSVSAPPSPPFTPSSPPLGMARPTQLTERSLAALAKQSMTKTKDNPLSRLSLQNVPVGVSFSTAGQEARVVMALCGAVMVGSADALGAACLLQRMGRGLAKRFTLQDFDVRPTLDMGQPVPQGTVATPRDGSGLASDAEFELEDAVSTPVGLPPDAEPAPQGTLPQEGTTDMESDAQFELHEDAPQDTPPNTEPALHSLGPVEDTASVMRDVLGLPLFQDTVSLQTVGSGTAQGEAAPGADDAECAAGQQASDDEVVTFGEGTGTGTEVNEAAEKVSLAAEVEIPSKVPSTRETSKADGVSSDNFSVPSTGVSMPVEHAQLIAAPQSIAVSS